MSRLKKAQRCCANTADGSRCGRFCAPGELVCAKHKPDAPLTGVIAAQDTDDPVVILRRLMKDRDPRVRLRAVNAFLARQAKEEKGCARCAERSASETDNGQIVEYASPAQRADLASFIKAIQSIKAAVREYIAQGGLPPTQLAGHRENSHAAVIERDQPPRPSAEVSESSVERARAASDNAPSDEVVMVWKDGALRAEPRSARAWKAVRP